MEHSNCGRVAARGGQMEEEQGLFPSLNGPSRRLEGNFKSRGSSRDNIAAVGSSAYLCGEATTNSDQPSVNNFSLYLTNITSQLFVSLIIIPRF